MSAVAERDQLRSTERRQLYIEDKLHIGGVFERRGYMYARECVICCVSISSNAMARAAHVRGKKHQEAERRYLAHRMYDDALAEDRRRSE